jgi:hypothetical protein
MVTEILAIDPGKKAAGVALFTGGHLKACTLARAASPLGVAREVARWASTRTALPRLVIENQQVYRGVKQDPNDLLPLAQCVGACAALISHVAFDNPLPRVWKGTVKKEIMLMRIQERLTPVERLLLIDAAPKSLLHNVIDAVGIGLWACGRL